jgi:aminopeptidase-like protein
LQEAMMWILSLADGQNDMLSIAERSGLSFGEIHQAMTLLESHHLVSAYNQPCREEFCRNRDALTD